MAIDITERKRNEEALRLATHKLGLLLGITRHEVLNKTSAIAGYLASSVVENPRPRTSCPPDQD